ncbi:MAG: hypothetical protein ACP5N7_03375 [Candidatus Pacearchaeota archaeon]
MGLSKTLRRLTGREQRTRVPRLYASDPRFREICGRMGVDVESNSHIFSHLSGGNMPAGVWVEDLRHELVESVSGIAEIVSGRYCFTETGRILERDKNASEIEFYGPYKHRRLISGSVMPYTQRYVN